MTLRPELARLLVEVEGDRAALSHQLGCLQSLDLAKPHALEAAAWALHHAYSAIESILSRVARVVEQVEPKGGDWLRDLLEAARRPMPEIRPALLGDDTVAALHHLRGFRHFVRHAYGVDLEHEEVARHMARALAVAPLIARDLDALDRWIATVGG